MQIIKYTCIRTNYTYDYNEVGNFQFFVAFDMPSGEQLATSKLISLVDVQN